MVLEQSARQTGTAGGRGPDPPPAVPICLFRYMTKYRNEDDFSVEDLTTVAAALSDPNRVRALLALRDGELCVCQITALLQLAPSTVSKHMAILRQAGLVFGRKQQRWMHYRLATGAQTQPMISDALRWVEQYLEESSQARLDRDRLARIVATPAHVLCAPDR